MSADCTGAARLQDTSAGITRNISFVLNQGSTAGQVLQYVFTDSGVIGAGEAKQQ